MDVFETIVEPFSKIPAPDFNTTHIKPVRVLFPYSQDAKKFSLPENFIELESSWDNYKIPIHDLPNINSLDLFSKRHLREKISALNLQIKQYESDDITKKKREANPYTLLKKPIAKFKNQGVTRMANLVKLFPELIEKNFMLSEFKFLTLADKGGYSEYIVDQYRSKFFEDPIGYSLFPKTAFKVDSVSLRTEGDIGFPTIQAFAEDMASQDPDPSFMLIYNDLSWKELDHNLEEKYMKLYLAYSIFLSVKLLARGGNMIIKLYNTSHPATIELIYMIASIFKSISLVKLISSSPHSSSRVLVGLDFCGSEDLGIFENMCIELEKTLHNDQDLEHVVDFAKIAKNDRFQDYVVNQNSAVAESQIIALQRLLGFLEDVKVQKIDKDEVCEKCLVDWKLIEMTMEEKKEHMMEVPTYTSYAKTVAMIKNERAPDISGIMNIVDRYPSQKKDIKLKNSARKRPEEIIPQRSIDIEKLASIDMKTSIEDLRFFKPKQSKSKVQKKPTKK